MNLRCVFLIICFSCAEIKPEPNETNEMSLGFIRKERCVDTVDSDGNYWARSDGKEQAGGFFWFIGKSKDKNYSKAFEKSEGNAVSKLVTECGVAHQNAVFNERCANKVKDQYFTYSRLTIKSDDCIGTIRKNASDKKKYESPQLKRLYIKHLKTVGEKFLECNETNYKSCNNMANTAANEGDIDLAIKYSKIACNLDKDNNDSCLHAGDYIYEKDKKESIRLWKVGCHNGNAIACYQAGSTEFLAGKKISGLALLTLACKKAPILACAELGKAHYSLGDNKKSLIVLSNGCSKKSGESCRLWAQLVRTYTQKLASASSFREMFTRTLSAFDEGCEYYDAESCFEASRMYLIVKKKSTSNKRRKKACKLGFKKACRKK